MRDAHLHAERCLDMHSERATHIVNRGGARMANVIVHLLETDRPPAYTICLSYRTLNITYLFVNVIRDVERARAQLGKYLSYRILWSI